METVRFMFHSFLLIVLIDHPENPSGVGICVKHLVSIFTASEL